MQTLDLSSLRRLAPLTLLRTLRAHQGKQFALLLEDESSTALLPILIVLAVAAGASTITAFHADGTTTPVRRRGAVRATLALGLATLTVRLAARQAASETAALSAAPRAPRRMSDADSVLYINANLWFGLKAGGSVGHVAGVVNALLHRGLTVDVAAVAPQPLVDSRAGFIRLPPPRSFGLPPELNQYRFSQSTAGQLRHLDHSRYRFIYQRLSLGNYAGAVLATKWGLPLVLEYNGSEVWVARHWGRPLSKESLAEAAEAAMLHQADIIVTVSRVLGDDLVARGIDPARIVVHPNGVDPAMFDPSRFLTGASGVRRKLGISSTAIVITFLGTFGKWHGTEVLASAISGLATTDSGWLEANDIHFLIVGDGLQMPLVRSIIGHSASGRVHFTGLVPQADAPSFLAASTIVVSPHVPNEDGSPFFGSPTKLFEYMAMALPIVASELDQIRDVLQPSIRVAEVASDGLDPATEVAVLAAPGSEQELAAGIRFLVERPDWRQVIGANARRLALERYTWDAHVAAVVARLEEV